MSYNNFQKSLEFLFPSEGGYNNHKYDKGGPTNLGVTQYTYNSYRKRHGLPQKDIRQITKDEAIKIYYDDYWMLSGADEVSDPKMSLLLFDTAVLHGPGKAREFYKESSGDINKFLDIRRKSYDEIVSKDPTQKVFYTGWQNRVNNLQNKINGMTDNNVDKYVIKNDNNYLEDEKNNINSNKLFKLSVEKNDYIPEITFDDVNNAFNVDGFNSTPSIENPNQIPQSDMINYIFDQEMKNYRQNKLQTQQENFTPIQQEQDDNLSELDDYDPLNPNKKRKKPRIPKLQTLSSNKLDWYMKRYI